MSGLSLEGVTELVQRVFAEQERAEKAEARVAELEATLLASCERCGRAALPILKSDWWCRDCERSHSDA